MARYQNSQFLAQSNDAAFNQEHRPGGQVPYSGIYRCMGCGREIVAEQSRQFPPQNHHQHTSAQGQIRWRLIVFADHNAK